MPHKIIITGPESTGKTTLAFRLAREFDGLFVPEYARTYLEKLERKYEQSDLLAIAHQQHDLEQMGMNLPQPVFCDTDILTIKIWSEEVFGSVDPKILELWENQTATIYLLCAPDVPWEYDPMRENPYDRDRLFNIYQDHLENKSENFSVIRGGFELRTKAAIELVHRLLFYS